MYNVYVYVYLYIKYVYIKYFECIYYNKINMILLIKHSA